MNPKPNKITEFLTTALDRKGEECFLRVYQQMGRIASAGDMDIAFPMKFTQERPPQYMYEALMIYIYTLRTLSEAEMAVRDEFIGAEEPMPKGREEREILEHLQHRSDHVLSSPNSTEIHSRMKAMRREMQEAGYDGVYAYHSQCNLILAEAEHVIFSSYKQGLGDQLKGWDMLRRLPHIMEDVSRHWVQPLLRDAEKGVEKAADAMRQESQGGLSSLSKSHQAGQRMQENAEFYRTLAEFPQVVKTRVNELRGRELG